MPWMRIVFAYPRRQKENSNGEACTARPTIAIMKNNLINK